MVRVIAVNTWKMSLILLMIEAALQSVPAIYEAAVTANILDIFKNVTGQP